MSLTASSWNLNGWTTETKMLRDKLIHLVDSDIYCLNETHLAKDGNLECEGYISYLNNRQIIYRNSPKWSGGVAVLVKRDLYDDFKVQALDKEFDGILVMEFENKNSGFTFVLFCCYLLPPENKLSVG